MPTSPQGPARRPDQDQTASRRQKWRPARFAALAAALAAPLALPAAARAAAPIPLELNKLEPLTEGGPACRVYFVVTNPDKTEISQLRLDLILFGTDGIIARRVALDLGPLPPGKTSVRLFDLQGQACSGIGRVLVNDVLACKTGGGGAAPASSATASATAEPPGGEREACLDRLSLSSRAKVPLSK
ncbi:MAG TPA: Tat pathway signal protein [Acetobacteraceae bacterium]|nr:Tat pathway signal protein [Acetobacteraceae bacterium]